MKISLATDDLTSSLLTMQTFLTQPAYKDLASELKNELHLFSFKLKCVKFKLKYVKFKLKSVKFKKTFIFD